MQSECLNNENLYLPFDWLRRSVVVLGEVIWDIFEDSKRLGGAALNFAVHASRLGFDATLISAVGADPLGEEAMRQIADLGLDTRLLHVTRQYPTGCAVVRLDSNGQSQFIIERPAAYDAIEFSGQDFEPLVQRNPAWFYFGTLFAATPQGQNLLSQLLAALPGAARFYDVNLRPGWSSDALVLRLLELADVVKLNEEELHAVSEFTGLPTELEAFCRAGAERFGWQAVGVTLGAQGCAALVAGEFVEAAGHPVEVADTVGAGDAFAAAFLHGLVSQWPAGQVAAFANRLGALVASRHGALPNWSIEEVAQSDEPGLANSVRTTEGGSV